jgi:hypothetical protein
LCYRIEHHVLGLEIPVNDLRSMSSLNSCTNLRDDDRGFFTGKWRIYARVFLEEIASGPLDSKKMQPILGLADFYGAHHVGVLHTSSVLRFSYETSDGSLVVPKLLSENLKCDSAMDWMLSLVYLGCTALSNLTLNRIPGYL